MTTPLWAPGTFYNPGALVRPRSAPPVDVGQPDNPGFETGNITSWSFTSGGGVGAFTSSTDQALSGTHSGKWAGGNGTGPESSIFGNLVNDERAAVNPGQTIIGKCYIKYNTNGQHTGSQGWARIAWYDASLAFISYTEAQSKVVGSGRNNRWNLSTVTGVAPSNAAFASMGAYMQARGGTFYIDDFSWNYAYAGPPAGLIFKAVQPNAGFSGSAEPTWPVTVGVQVVDNQVIWEAVLTSRVVWEASPILLSGSAEPVFPTLVGGVVVDGTIAWKAISRRIEDARCPNSKAVAIAASKIFAGDRDIIAFSATVNPLDWSTPNDAGYLPFGLQMYGSNPVAVLGLYRSNLIAFNSEGFQMWQVDQDPANMAFLDAVPVGSSYARANQPVANDLIFLNPVGFRNISIAGASTNLQADGVGEPIDSLVTAEIKAAFEPIGLYWPAQGQFWGFFGAQAFVLTINATKNKSWSRYVFPAAIDDWTLLGNDLYLRAGDLVWKVDADALRDDEHVVGPDIVGTDFVGIIHWPHLDLGSFGAEKTMVGVDLVANASQSAVAISIGYDQRNLASRTPDYTVDPDTLPGQLIAFPLSAPSFDLRLTFAAGQTWEWFAANLYVL